MSRSSQPTFALTAISLCDRNIIYNSGGTCAYTYIMENMKKSPSPAKFLSRIPDAAKTYWTDAYFPLARQNAKLFSRIRTFVTILGVSLEIYSRSRRFFQKPSRWKAPTFRIIIWTAVIHLAVYARRISKSRENARRFTYSTVTSRVKHSAENGL